MGGCEAMSDVTAEAGGRVSKAMAGCRSGRGVEIG